MHTIITMSLIDSTNTRSYLTIGRISKAAYENNCDLREALQSMTPDFDNIKIEDTSICYGDDMYRFPDATRYENTSLSDERWETLLTDMEYMQHMLDHPQMSIPRAYINICLYKEEVLTMEQFDAANGGQVPFTTEDLINYAQDLADNGMVDIPDDLYPYINWEALGNSFIDGREMTDPDPYTNEQWFIV